MEKLTDKDNTQKTILLPLDGPETAQKTILPAKSLAILLKSHLHIIHICSEPLSHEELIKKLKINPKELPEFIIDHRHGDPAQILLEEEKSANFIIIHINGNNYTEEEVTNPLAVKIMENSDIPVLLIRSDMNITTEDHLWKPQKILMPLDGTPEAAQALDASIEIIKKTKARIDVLHIFSSLDKELEGDSLNAPYYEDAPLQEWDSWSKEFLKRFFPSLSDFADINLSLSKSKGNPGEAIINFSKENKNDLVILAWKGNLSPSHAATLKRVIRGVPCPILLKKIVEQQKYPPSQPVE